jgi:hypothetical protein
MNNSLKILLKSKNLGNKHNATYLNKNNFIKFSNDYCHNLIRYNYNIKNLNVYEDTENSNFIGEIELDITNENDQIKNVLNKLKDDDLFYLFRKKYYQHNLYIKINYLQQHPVSEFNHNQDIFLL